jgi:capsule polysaccharide export protein KpsE/RkpR
MTSINENRDSSRLDSTHLLLVVYDRLRIFIFVGVLSVIISAGVSLLIDEEFESTVIMFATTQSSIGEQFFEESKRGDLLAYGEMEDAERLLQLLNSNHVRSQIIKNHHLSEHYGIDLSEAGSKTLLYKEYDSKVGADLTRYGSIKIHVLDTDPIISKDIANDLVFLVDSLANSLRNDRAQNALILAENSYNIAVLDIQLAEDSLGKLHAQGMYNFGAQVEGLTAEYGRAVADNNMKGARILKNDLARISKLANRYNKLINFLAAEYKQLGTLKKRHDLMKVDASTQLPSSLVVDYAEAADKKSYPVRWLIVFVSAISSLAMTLILLLVFDSIKGAEIRNK